MKNRHERWRNKVIHKYKLGQTVYVYDCNQLKQGAVIGIKFQYETDELYRKLVCPTYLIEVGIYSLRHTIIKSEFEVFKTEIECIKYVLKKGILKKEEQIL